MSKLTEFMRFCAQKNTETIRQDISEMSGNLHRNSDVASSLRQKMDLAPCGNEDGRPVILPVVQVTNNYYHTETHHHKTVNVKTKTTIHKNSWKEEVFNATQNNLIIQR